MTEPDAKPEPLSEAEEKQMRLDYNVGRRIWWTPPPTVPWEVARIFATLDALRARLLEAERLDLAQRQEIVALREHRNEYRIECENEHSRADAALARADAAERRAEAYREALEDSTEVLSACADYFASTMEQAVRPGGVKELAFSAEFVCEVDSVLQVARAALASASADAPAAPIVDPAKGPWHPDNHCRDSKHMCCIKSGDRCSCECAKCVNACALAFDDAPPAPVATVGQGLTAEEWEFVIQMMSGRTANFIGMKGIEAKLRAVMAREDIRALASRVEGKAGGCGGTSRMDSTLAKYRAGKTISLEELKRRLLSSEDIERAISWGELCAMSIPAGAALSQEDSVLLSKFRGMLDRKKTDAPAPERTGEDPSPDGAA